MKWKIVKIAKLQTCRDGKKFLFRWDIFPDRIFDTAQKANKWADKNGSEPDVQSERTFLIEEPDKNS